MPRQIRSSFYTITIGDLILRFVTAFIILWISAFFSPRFEQSSLFTLIVAAVVLSTFDYLINSIVGVQGSMLSYGIIGFMTCAIVLYSTQFFVSSYTISISASIIGALIYGMIISLIPQRQNKIEISMK